ncbi:hypothetical protein A3B45_05235 [Candidatus Daviesbacteria bacterium RIFCSPLOWO2_01_FULL_39_12]|uniref:Uncharacterized protein n=1 Tax=Candidatus Daviesbacteria bacterium RIFCSPLOWO2_01_FULL_39_12 TaxID=1797785 RepID=A0A1F5KT06_9BACT|nr:MAG: hypothetical protein A3B45_05235 [Candidatus Daviesbacteria bacterium RIFCSPLOWO2_01_FULL_39_12]
MGRSIEYMEGSEASNQLLKNKYNLHDSPEAKTAALRREQRTGERVAQNPLDRIQNYLNRFHEIIDQDTPERSEHALDLIKGRFHRKYVIKPNEIPEDYFENQRRLAREQGHGDIQIDQQTRKQLTEVIIADQTSSLDKWMDYLSSSDAPYSDGLKYWTLRSVVDMAEYDKDRKTYPQRSKGTTKPFPDLNREALAYVLDAVEKKYQGQKSSDPEFDNILKTENFAKLYAWAIEKVTPASEEELSATNGAWVKYNQDSDHMPLVQSLQGHGTGWCTAGESTAQTQLQGGDFYVYYSMDKAGKPTVPRAAIRMEGGKIAEVRGIAPEQNLDSGAVHIVEEKLTEFGAEGERYKKRVHDMELLTAIGNKVQKALMLDRDELLFLYEVNTPIDGFGYGKDPRISQLRFGRQPYDDLPIMFECTPDQIAHKASEIKPHTKAYIGPLEKGIFNRLQQAGIEHVYTSFPEGKIRMQKLEIGGKSKQQLVAEMKQQGINIYEYAQQMIDSPDFTTLPQKDDIDLVRLTVQDLGLKGTPTTDEVYAKAGELGLDLCPAEVGPHLRLKDTNQPLGEWYFIGMKQIADRVGYPGVFYLARDGDGLWLSDGWARPDDVAWSPGHEFVFALRKETETQTLKTPGLFDRIFKR